MATSKGKLHVLNRKHFSHISERAKGAKEELEQAKRQVQLAPSNAVFLGQVTSKRQAAHRLCEAERSFLQQQAKCTYLRNCDKGTKFFHALVKRNRKNFIAAITNSDDTVSTSLEQVSTGFVDYYSSSVSLEEVNPNVFSFGPSISEEQSQVLCRDFTDAEIRAVLDAIGNDKSPGPDGFSALFLKKAWAIVGEFVLAAVKEVFRNGQLLKQINHAVIALIPKSTNASTVDDFRPIACCNVVYKLIAKVLSARIGPCLSSIIDKAQAAFVPGRNMKDNILLMQQLIRGYNRKRTSPRCIIKIDLRKASDSIS